MIDNDEYIRSDRDLADDYRRGLEAADRVISDYQRDNESLRAERDRLRTALAFVSGALGEIVESEGVDAGVILISDASPTHYDAEHKCHVYDFENFSLLGNALVELARRVKADLESRE